ncbi:MAG: methylmalonyl Co-A mutase-associated GTPase MeaB [bacterium]
MNTQHKYLLKDFNNGSRRALARIISLVENDGEIEGDIRDKLYQRTGHAYRIGMTGPPGAGKSTLVNQMTKMYRAQGKTVGIIAVDPTSPFTGGALLGDRVRMDDHTLDKGVFIRSMATRGSLGGLSAKAQEAADVLDAFGKDIVIYETVGVGQSELDIVEAADTTVVVLVPESGDSVQAMKAGLMEIADIFVMNKADREGADRALRELSAILHLRPAHDWNPPVLKAVAIRNEGIEKILGQVEMHRSHLDEHELLAKKRKERFIKTVHALVSLRLKQDFWDEKAREILSRHIAGLDQNKTSPYRAAKQLLEHYRGSLV